MKMKVHFVMPSARRRGGAEEALLQLLAFRREAGLELCRVTFLEDGDLPALCSQLGAVVDVVEAGRIRQPWVGLRCIRQMTALFRREKPDAVVAWMTKAHLYSGPAARLAGVPAFYFQMGLPDGGVVDRLTRLVPANGGFGCSEFVAREQEAVVAHRVLPVTLSADHERFEKAAQISVGAMREKLGLPVEGTLVGLVGRLQTWKGVHHFLRAMAKVVTSCPQVRGLVVGGPHDEEPGYEVELRKLHAELQLESALTFAGAQSNPEEWMQAMDIVVHASDREPFGIVVVEAMALGKPVIAAKPGGPEEILTDGVEGLLVDFGDVDGLATAILRYLDDPDFALRCGRAAKERARLFTPAHYAERFGNALRELTGSLKT